MEKVELKFNSKSFNRFLEATRIECDYAGRLFQGGIFVGFKNHPEYLPSNGEFIIVSLVA